MVKILKHLNPAIDDSPKATICAFYGSLRPGCRNWQYLLANASGVKELGTKFAHGFAMVSLGGYPAAYSSIGSRITVTLFEISNNEVLRAIDGMELGAGYIRLHPVIDGRRCLMYVWDHATRAARIESLPKVEDGDWLSYLKYQPIKY